jgi:hypothetical protein
VLGDRHGAGEDVRGDREREAGVLAVAAEGLEDERRVKPSEPAPAVLERERKAEQAGFARGEPAVAPWRAAQPRVKRTGDAPRVLRYELALLRRRVEVQGDLSL